MKRLETRWKSGFTLIELMVAVAIIGIMISLLLAALGKARHNARAALCLNHQRNIGQDAATFMANNNGRFPWLTAGGQWFHSEVLACPADMNPIMMPRQALDTPNDVAISYGFNPEFALYRIPMERVSNPSTKLLLYDGFGGSPDGAKKSGSGGTSGPDYFLDGGKMTVTHLPPGNNGNPQVTSISLSALDAHVGHNHPDSTHVDLIGNWVAGGRIDIPGYTKGDFMRRHPVGPGIGNVAFADGHAAYAIELDPLWYLFPN